jgi:hypothetical protein
MRNDASAWRVAALGLVVVLGWAGSGCKTTQGQQAKPVIEAGGEEEEGEPQTPLELYEEAVVDAAFVEPDEVVSELRRVALDAPGLVWNDDRSKLLVVTWKSRGSYEKFLKDQTQTTPQEDFVVWVTLASQVKDFCRALPEREPAKLDARLKQYLGLHPDWSYDVFVEMWVSPEDLFRPCVDPTTDDGACNLQFDKAAPTVKNIADYRRFYEHLYFKSFRESEGVPWTGLGYTYDWGNPDSPVGASEFILVPSASYQIKAATPTAEYCAP